MTTKDRNYYTMIVQDRPRHLLAIFNVTLKCGIDNTQPMQNMVMILILKWMVRRLPENAMSFLHLKWMQIIAELVPIINICPLCALRGWNMTTWGTNMFILPIKHRKLSPKHIIRRLRTIVLNSMKHKKHAIISKRTEFWTKKARIIKEQHLRTCGIEIDKIIWIIRWIPQKTPITRI